MAEIVTERMPASAVFIDVPNALSLNHRGISVCWERLGACIASEALPGTSLIHAVAYVRTFRKQGELSPDLAIRLQRLGPAGLDLRVREVKDIDAFIINDIWATIARYQRESVFGGRIWYPLQVRLILVSGDGDYLEAYQSLREEYSDHLEVQLCVYSWRSQLSRKLKRAATWVTYLDDIPGFLQ